MENRMEKHVLVAAVFQIAFGLIGLLCGVITFVAVAGGGFLSGDPDAIEITLFIAILVSSLLLLFSIPSIIGGIGLLRHRRWARILILVLSVVDLFAIPFGTALAFYTFWVLLSDDAAALFETGEEGVTESLSL